MSSTAAPDYSTLAAEYLNPVIASTRSVFEMMMGCTPKRSGLTLKDNTIPNHELSAVIGITGQATGTIVLSVSQQAALEILKRTVGEEAEEVNTEVCDAVGELTNMIAGQTKAQLEHLDLSLSIPNMVSGESYVVHYPSDIKPICILFDSEIGPFTIEFGFTN